MTEAGRQVEAQQEGKAEAQENAATNRNKRGKRRKCDDRQRRGKAPSWWTPRYRVSKFCSPVFLGMMLCNNTVCPHPAKIPSLGFYFNSLN
jgi:hypothetical protein